MKQFFVELGPLLLVGVILLALAFTFKRSLNHKMERYVTKCFERSNGPVKDSFARCVKEAELILCMEDNGVKHCVKKGI